MASSTERPYLDEATTEQLQKELERRTLRDKYREAQELYQAAVLLNSYGRQPHLWSALLKVAPACFGEWSVKDAADLTTLLSGVEAMTKHVVTAYEHLIDDAVGIPLELRDEHPDDSPAYIEASAQDQVNARILATQGLDAVYAQADDKVATYVPERICKHCNQDQQGHMEQTPPGESWHAYHPVENVSRLRFPVR